MLKLYEYEFEYEYGLVFTLRAVIFFIHKKNDDGHDNKLSKLIYTTRYNIKIFLIYLVF